MLTFLPIHVYTFSRFCCWMIWPLRFMLRFPLEWRAQAHTPEVQHIHPAKTENDRMHLKTIKFVVWKRLYAVKFNLNAKTFYSLLAVPFGIFCSFPGGAMRGFDILIILTNAYYVRGEQVAGCYIFKFISCEFCRNFQTYYSQADKIKQLKASMSFNKSYIFCSRKIIHLNIRANTPHLLLYLWSGNLIIKCLILSY